MTVFIAAFVGSLIGFLCTTPIRHLFYGWYKSNHWGIIAVLAIAVRKELHLLLCGVFLVENLSVVIQVSYFKYTKKTLWKAEESSWLHHHYQKKGYHESKIVTRFWIVAIMLAILLITLKLR
jgi:phospho-N-acetylmuramoyl-pentapeptide-transferase